MCQLTLGHSQLLVLVIDQDHLLRYSRDVIRQTNGRGLD